MFARMPSFILKIIFVCGFLFYTDKAFSIFLIDDNNISNLKNISLFKYLNETKEKLVAKFALDKDANDFKKFSKSFLVQLANETIDDFLCIIDGFNKKKSSCNLEIEIRFFGICSQFKLNEKLTPRVLRKIDLEVQSFDEYLKNYFESRKTVLNESEQNFIKTIQRFNFLLCKIFLNDEFLELNFVDKILDIILYHPWEVICDNKVIAITVLTLSTVVLGYALWPKKQAFEKEKCSDHDAILINKRAILNDNKNLITQLNAITQTGATCGFHAFKNALYLMLFDDPDEIEKRSTSDEKWNEWLSEMQKLVGDTNWIDGHQISQLLDENNLNKWEKYLNIKNFKEKMKLLKNIEVVDNSNDLVNYHSVNEDIIEKVKSLREKGQSQGVILNCGGHWYAIKIEKGKNEELFNISVINSFKSDVTNERNLKNIINFYEKEEMPTPEMLVIKRLAADCDNILKSEEKLHDGDSNEARINKAEKKLEEIYKISSDNKLFDNQLFLKKYFPYIFNVLEQISTPGILEINRLISDCDTIWNPTNILTRKVNKDTIARMKQNLEAITKIVNENGLANNEFFIREYDSKIKSFLLDPHLI